MKGAQPRAADLRPRTVLHFSAAGLMQDIPSKAGLDSRGRGGGGGGEGQGSPVSDERAWPQHQNPGPCPHPHPRHLAHSQKGLASVWGQREEGSRVLGGVLALSKPTSETPVALISA